MIRDLPFRRDIAVNGIDMAVWEWPGEGPPLLFCHATSFHARCWDQAVTHLPGRRVFAVDLRGHGASSKPQPPYSWRTLGEDVAGLVRALGLTGATGIGHSMGGHTLVLAAAHVPDVFARLVLLDPVIFPRASYTGARTEEHFAARRRNRWSSADEMYDRFAARPPFANWNRAVLRDYCRYGLTPAPDGDGLVLACPPAVEASIYMQSTDPKANIYDEIKTIQIPVRIIRSARMATDGPTDMTGSPTASDLASYFSHGEDRLDREHSHLFPMEAPELSPKWIE